MAAQTESTIRLPDITMESVLDTYREAVKHHPFVECCFCGTRLYVMSVKIGHQHWCGDHVLCDIRAGMRRMLGKRYT